jgi:enoyl-CoA hydratase
MSTISVMGSLGGANRARVLAQPSGSGKPVADATMTQGLSSLAAPVLDWARITGVTGEMLLIEKADGVAIVTMNRPEAMNAMSKALRAALDKAFTALDTDDVVLTGAGERAFTAGLDLKELGAEGVGAANATEPAANPVRAIQQCGKPVIGAINGVAITGGFELALACDVLIASTNARFADTHARVGIVPGWGLSQKLSRLIGIYRAKELSLTGNFLDAQTALAWGLVNRVVEPGELLTVARKLANDMATVPVEMLRFYKKLIDDGFDLPFGEAMALEHARSSARNSGVSADLVEKNRLEVLARGRKQ